MCQDFPFYTDELSLFCFFNQFQERGDLAAAGAENSFPVLLGKVFFKEPVNLNPLEPAVPDLTAGETPLLNTAVAELKPVPKLSAIDLLGIMFFDHNSLYLKYK